MANRFFLLLISCFATVGNCYAWTVDVDFECLPVAAKAEGICAFGEAFYLSKISNSQMAEGHGAAEIGIAAGETGWGQWGGIFTFPEDIVAGDEVWTRVYAFFPNGYDFSTNTGFLKFIRLIARTGDNAQRGAIDTLIHGNGGLTFGTEYVAGSYRYGFGLPVERGRWIPYEMYVKLDADPGQAVVRIWQNGELVHEDMSYPTLAESTDVLKWLYLFTYWNGGSPASQIAYVDKIVITTDTPPNIDQNGNFFIGLLPPGIRPKSPSDLAATK